jgi:bacteriocin-like protein
MTTTIKTAATSEQVREPTHELSEDELNAVVGGLTNAENLANQQKANVEQAKALQTFQQLLSGG